MGAVSFEQDQDAVDDGSALWIKSEADEHGTYHVYLELGEDDVIPLGVDDAYGWAREVLSAVAAAEYDAAVLHQADALGLEDAAVEVVTQLRADRAEHVPVSAIPGLALVPGVSAATRMGFLRLERHGEPIGQWELEDARQHALAVIEAFEVSILDSSYLRMLERAIGVERDRALQVVADLYRHRR